jgi:recombination protein RecT
MWRKTAVKRLCKYLPLSVDLATAISLDNQAEVGEQQDFIEADIISSELAEDEEKEEQVTKSEAVAQKLNEQ